MSAIDLSQLTLSAEQVKDLRELLLQNLKIASIVTDATSIRTGIKYNTKVGAVGGFGLVGKANGGCESVSDGSASVAEYELAPKAWEIFISDCVDSFLSTSGVWSMKRGDVDWEAPESYVQIATEYLAKAINDFYLRLAFLGDTNIETITDGGYLDDNVSTDYFNLIDGIFVQAEALATAGIINKVTIAENAGATYSAQAITPQHAYDALKGLVDSAPYDLRMDANGIIICTQSIADGYRDYLLSQGVHASTSIDNIKNGVADLSIYGIKVVALPELDAIIRTNFNDGTAWYKPHRAIYCSQDNLVVSVDGEEGIATAESWYDKGARKINFRAYGLIDAKITTKNAVLAI